jgi:hypothetical protein
MPWDSIPFWLKEAFDHPTFRLTVSFFITFQGYFFFILWSFTRFLVTHCYAVRPVFLSLIHLGDIYPVISEKCNDSTQHRQK